MLTLLHVFTDQQTEDLGVFLSAETLERYWISNKLQRHHHFLLSTKRDYLYGLQRLSLQPLSLSCQVFQKSLSFGQKVELIRRNSYEEVTVVKL